MRLDLSVGDVSPPPGHVDAREAGLLPRYEAYRRRQATRLVHMLPDGAVRPLYRRARAAALEAGVPEPELGDDPLGTLLRYCEALLPLPPFDVWRADVERNPAAHYGDMADSVDQPTSEEPATIDARSFDCDGRAWTAQLRSFRDSGLWRGYIAFQEPGSTAVHRTAAVFCEHDPVELRERFASFESAALQAFLRSALP